MALAQLNFSNSEIESAIDILTKLVAEAPNSEQKSKARLMLAQIKASQNDQAGASELVEAVLSKDGKNVDALTIRASLRLANGGPLAAIEDLRTALNEAPDSPRVLMLIADAYDQNGDAALAEENYVKAVRLSKFSPDVGIPYVRLLMRYGKTDQAERLLTEIRTNAPQNEPTLTLLAQIKLSKGDWEGVSGNLGCVEKTRRQVEPRPIRYWRRPWAVRKNMTRASPCLNRQRPEYRPGGSDGSPGAHLCRRRQTGRSREIPAISPAIRSEKCRCPGSPRFALSGKSAKAGS